MQLQLSTWPEVEAYLSRSRGIVVPIGSTEQHGPTGLIGTDAICAEVIARGVGQESDALVAPTINVGMAQHHMAFPGTMTLRPSTMVAVIRDNVLCLAEHGFQRFLFVNGHGGNVATIGAAFAEIYNELRARLGEAAPAVRCRQMNWWDVDGVRGYSREAFGIAEGSHATPSEVALTQWAYPDEIKRAVLEPPIAPSGSFYDARHYRSRFPDGRIGSNPGLATPEHGQRLYDIAVAGLSQAYRNFLAED
ncbi:MAG: creatininase family protein [Azospirillaceae bacterium]|nr:creatininase family protein [Azospirillaceae bacterium]